MSRTLEKDFYLEVAKGNIPGHSLERKFGSIDSIAAATPADVWEYGITAGAERYTFSLTADINKLTSDNNADNEEITIIGLDTDGNEVVQTNNLTGQTEVILSTPLWRVNRAYNSNGTDLLGNVYVFTGTSTAGVPDSVTNVRGYISIGEGQTLQTIYTVPAGKTAYFVGLEASMTKGGGATVVTANFRGKTRAFGKVFRTQDEFELVSHGSSIKTYNFPIPLPFTEKTDFCPIVDVSANGVGVSWAFTMVLVDN